jgi:putative transposase
VPVDPALYRRQRFPAEIIGHAVWLSFRFNLSHRDVEELLAERGIQVSYAASRLWCRKFGPAYAEQLRRRRPGPADKWHVDERQLRLRGKKDWLWRAVDQDGWVPDIPVQERRNEQAAVAFLRRVLTAAGGAPRVIITDKLASYVPAVRRVLPTAEHRRHTRVNNRAENSHVPVRKRERILQRFKLC